MIVLQKKKILLCIGLLTFSMLMAGVLKSINTKEVVQIVSLPVSNKVIILDARTW